MLVLTLFILAISFLALNADADQPLKSNTYTDIMVVGGDIGVSYLDDVEIVSLNGTTNCMKPSDYPTESRGMVATFVNGMALVCGGFPYTSDCFTYDFDNGNWTRKVSMESERYGASAVMLNDSHWWVTGGWNRSFLETTELYDLEAETFSPFIDLPDPTYQHIVFRLDENHVFLCCGGGMSGKSYILDLVEEIWTETPRSSRDHYGGFAGIINIAVSSSACY